MNACLFSIVWQQHPLPQAERCTSTTMDSDSKILMGDQLLERQWQMQMECGHCKQWPLHLEDSCNGSSHCHCTVLHCRIADYAWRRQKNWQLTFGGGARLGHHHHCGFLVCYQQVEVAMGRWGRETWDNQHDVCGGGPCACGKRGGTSTRVGLGVGHRIIISTNSY